MEHNNNGKDMGQEAMLAGTDREAVLKTLDKVCQSMAALARTVDRLKLELETNHRKQKRALNERNIASRLH